MVNLMTLIGKSVIQISKMKKFLVPDVGSGFYLMFRAYLLMKYFLFTKRMRYLWLGNIKGNLLEIFIRWIINIFIG